jgi:hypothetical protein
MLHCTKENPMNLQIENSMSEIAQKARGRYEDAVKGARQSTEKAAGRVSKSKKPVKTISRLGLKLSGVSHRTANKLWKQQTRLVEGQIDAVAGRLKAAADAEDLRDLLKTQIELIPENTGRFADEARAALKIFKGAGGEIRELVKGTVAELKGEKPVARKATARKTTRATATKPALASPETAGNDQAASLQGNVE